MRRISAQSGVNPVRRPSRSSKSKIHSSAGALVASGDNWAAPAAAGFAQAGAFALASGSKDAAVVVTLSAGASYTAVVSGVDGATGEALVEIYDLR